MANTVYPKGLASIASAAINLSSVNMEVALMNGSQAYSSAHQYVSDLTGADIIARSGNFTASSITGGVISATPVTISAVAIGSTIAALVVYHNTGTDSTCDLLCWIDTDSSAGAISIPTNGSNIVIDWNGSGSAAEIFAI